MRRTINLIALAMTLTAAFALYAVKYDARRLQAQIDAQERALVRAENELAVLKAERAHLASPARIEELARAQGLRPARSAQFRNLDDIPRLPGASASGR